jgi:prepilin-type processing-associated H-X9-DG protein
MPAGMIVTKDSVDFDIGKWQHKTYDNASGVYQILRSKWCSNTINILFFDGSIDDFDWFWQQNDFGVIGRNAYHIYTVVVPQSMMCDRLITILNNRKILFTRYDTHIQCENKTILVNNFIRNMLCY